MMKKLHNRCSENIRETKQGYLRDDKAHQWVSRIANFKGIKNYSALLFESLREELLKPKDDPFN